MAKPKTKPKKKSQKKIAEASYTTVTEMEGGHGQTTRRCYDCNGTGRVHEGGYGMTNCHTCSRS